MNDLVVIMGATVQQGLIAEYVGQLDAAGIDNCVQVLDSPIPNGWQGNLGYKLDLFRKWVTEVSHYEKIVITDAFDMLFYGSKEEVMAKVPNDFVVMAGERNCYPEVSLADRIKAETMWAFVNGGFTAGTPKNLIAWMDAIEAHSQYEPLCLDQLWFNRRLAEQSPLVRLDSSTHLVYCLHSEKGELQKKDGRPWNSVCDSYPAWVHFNGRHPVGTFREIMEAE